MVLVDMLCAFLGKNDIAVFKRHSHFGSLWESKVWLPKLFRLDEGDGKVAMTSISVPYRKNALPTWLHDDLTLFSYMPYYAQKNNTSNKIRFQTNVKLPDIKNHLDLSFMRAHSFLKGLIEHKQKL